MIVIAVSVRMAMIMIVVVGLAEDQGADEVDREAQHGNDGCLFVPDRLCCDEPLDRTDEHHGRNPEQKDCARKPA